MDDEQRAANTAQQLNDQSLPNERRKRYCRKNQYILCRVNCANGKHTETTKVTNKIRVITNHGGHAEIKDWQKKNYVNLSMRPQYWHKWWISANKQQQKAPSNENCFFFFRLCVCLHAWRSDEKSSQWNKHTWLNKMKNNRPPRSYKTSIDETLNLFKSVSKNRLNGKQ